MFRELARKIFGEKAIDLPPEYGAWMGEIIPLMNHCLSLVDRNALNKNTNGNLRILVKLFLLGIVDFYKEKMDLTFGQHRYLYIAAGQKVGFSSDSLSVTSDSRDNLQIIAPELVLLARDALDAGYRTSREYFTAGDTRGNFLLTIKLKQWSDPNYKPPEQPELTPEV